jgi:hypothetical protein
MHCSLSFGSIGARAKLTGIPSHHHTAAIAPRDIRKSISGMLRETSSVLLAGMIRWASSMREAGRLKNHILTIEDAITHNTKVCFSRSVRSGGRVASLQCAPAIAAQRKEEEKLDLFVGRARADFKIPASSSIQVNF